MIFSNCEDKHYLVANDIAGKADKTDLQYVSAGVDYVSGHIPTTVAQLTDSANYYTINQTSAASAKFATGHLLAMSSQGEERKP